MLAAGIVVVGGAVRPRPETMVDAAAPIELLGSAPRYVSRGGDKLDGALDDFAIDVAGRRCLDAGSSTGGFTDCLLTRGALAVTCADVGRGQLAWRLRRDPRVRVLERTDIRELQPTEVGAVELLVADLSFISLRTVLPALVALAGRADMVALVKPQFELARRLVGRGGIVGDPALEDQAVEDVVEAAVGHGLECRGRTPSRLRGADGNQEHFVWLRAGA